MDDFDGINDPREHFGANGPATTSGTNCFEWPVGAYERLGGGVERGFVLGETHS